VPLSGPGWLPMQLGRDREARSSKCSGRSVRRSMGFTGTTSHTLLTGSQRQSRLTWRM
jgi:hypothetical protein